jgi:sporulation protein YlmC with PRC-barrel domain
MWDGFLALPVGLDVGSQHVGQQDKRRVVRITIGAEARCSDQSCGRVSRVVVDPVARAVTHLAVEPKHRQGLGRLVPLDLVDLTTGEVRLQCTAAGLDELGHAEESQFLPASGGRARFAPGQDLPQPFQGLGNIIGDVPRTFTYDAVPLNEVEVRPGQQVHATDGAIGKVEGLVIDVFSRHITHVLLSEGHLWGRKDVAIPIGSVATVNDGIHLNIGKRDISELPPVNVPNRGRPSN